MNETYVKLLLWVVSRFRWIKKRAAMTFLMQDQALDDEHVSDLKKQTKKLSNLLGTNKIQEWSRPAVWVKYK